MGNLIKFTKEETDPQFKKLTSLLHWKDDSKKITQADLDSVYCDLFNVSQKNANGKAPMVDLIREEAKKCLSANGGTRFEHKIVLSIAIRIDAERFMIGKIGDSKFVTNIDTNQTQKLLARFEKQFGNTPSLKTLQRVVLMTPEEYH